MTALEEGERIFDSQYESLESYVLCLCMPMQDHLMTGGAWMAVSSKQGNVIIVKSMGNYEKAISGQLCS